MKLDIIELKRNLLYYHGREPNLIAILDDRVIGSYHPVYWEVSSLVAGMPLACNNMSELEWESALYRIINSCPLAIGHNYFGNWAVRFPDDEVEYEYYLYGLCASCVYDDRREFYVIKASDTKYLEYLGVNLR